MNIKIELSLIGMNIDDIPRISQLIKMGVRVMANNVELTVPRSIIDQFRDIGVEVSLEKINTNSYLHIEDVINVLDNLESDDQELTLSINRECSLHEYLRLIRRPFVNADKISLIMSSYRILFREYDSLTESEKSEVFRRSHFNNRREYLRYMLNRGYQPDLDNLNINYPKAAIILLEHIQMGDREKYKLFEKLASSVDDIEFYLHPSTDKYWRRFKGENHRLEHYCRALNVFHIRDGMHRHLLTYDAEKIREHILLGEEYSCENIYDHYKILSMAYDVLTQTQRERHFAQLVGYTGGLFYDSTNPIFRDLWSVVPTENMEFLWFLYCNNIPLPPSKSINEDIASIPRLLQEEDQLKIIKKLLEENRDYHLLRFLNETNFNIRTLMGLNPKLDLLIQRYPIGNMKSARTK